MPETSRLEAMGESLKQYLALNVELLKLEITRRSSEIGSSLVSSMILGISLLLFILMFSIGLGFYLSALIGDTYSGFAIVAGAYLLFILVFLLIRKRFVEKPMRDKIVRKMLEQK